MTLPIAQKLRRIAAAVSLLLLAFTLLPKVLAQETTGAIQGTVTDPTGAIVTGATVTATGDKLIQPATATTDSHGFYRLNALPPGNYTLIVSGSGMKAKATDLNLTAGALPNLNFKLSAANTEVVIDVSSSVALVDVTQSKVETTITNDILQELPKGRSFQSVIPFAPGARQEPLQSLNTASTINGNLNANRSGGFQIDGASDSENLYTSEGVNITAISGGGVGYNVPTEFVQDVQVKSSSFEAEFGGALGGVVNVIQQRGGNDWHGGVFMYYRSSAMNANDQCNFFNACGVRKDPNSSSNTTTRIDQTYQYFVGKQDHYRTVNPGFTIGGSLYPRRLWLFASYVPEFYRVRRTVLFTGKVNPGLRDMYASQDQHYGFTRLDYAPLSKLRLFASWQDLYTRQIGSLPNPDSISGNQVNTSASVDPTTIRPDTGTVNPASIYAFGGDYVVTSNLLLSARYGYTYANSEDRGKPIGLRYVVTNNGSTGIKGFDGTTIGAVGSVPYSQASGFSNISSNAQSFFNVLSRKNFTVDVSYVKTGIFGTHNFKTGYNQSSVLNTLLSGFNTSEVDLFYGQSYSVATNASACDAIIAANKVQYPTTATSVCRGNYGYFTVHDGVDNSGVARGNNRAVYFQDGWTVGKTGLTINAGVRFDTEYLPPYSAGASSISFGWGDKIAPRIGGAYDLLHNGKLKVYASYGQFYDIIKYSLPSGSFGGQYWHDCTYAMDDPDYTKILPTAPGLHGCPASGPAPGVTVGRFIENVDFRKNIINTQDPGVDPNVKPMKQHEVVAGADWAATPTMAFTARYARKRLDNTVEDIGATDTLGFYIGNPGPGYGDTLHRTLYSAGFTAPLCSACPVQPKAIREYDGLELSVTKTSGSHFFYKAIYAYSKLAGNYPGLTSTFNTDGAGGRHNPNNNRSFDQPQMAFDAHGKPFGGPLPTDRPNTFQGFGSFRQKWFGGDSQLGLSQAILQGTPVSLAVPTLGTTSSVQFVEGQGSFVPYTLDSVGNLVPGAIQHDRRTPAYLQTDANFTHYVHVSKEHENRKIGAELNVYNLLNQHAVTGYNEVPITAATAPPPVTSNPTGFDFLTLTTNFDYTGVMNGKKNILSSTYNQPNLFQSARQLRLKIAYTF
jgi:carboxypeptidase family protein